MSLGHLPRSSWKRAPSRLRNKRMDRYDLTATSNPLICKDSHQSSYLWLVQRFQLTMQHRWRPCKVTSVGNQNSKCRGRMCDYLLRR